MMEDNLLEFFNQLNRDALSYMDECYHVPEVAFTKYVVTSLYSFFDTEDPEFCQAKYIKSDDSIEGEIHGYAISRNGDVLMLFYTIHQLQSGDIPTLKQEEVNRALNRMQGFYNKAIKGHTAVSGNGRTSKEAVAASDAIHAAADTINSVELYVLSNGNIKKCELDKVRIPSKHVEPVVWDFNKIYANLVSGKDHLEINIDFENDYKYKIPYIKMESESFGYQCILAMFPAKLLYRLYEKYNTKLLLGNVRYYLGMKKTKKYHANSGMVETLEKENQMFLAYNNGVTALATGFVDIDANKTEKIDVTEEDENAGSQPDVQQEFISMGILKSLQDFRIVNGGQTTATIYEARNPHSSHSKKVSLLGVYVQVKILIFNKNVEELASKITEYSNTQNPVKISDFSVGCPFIKTIESLSRDILIPNARGDVKMWYFERLRGQYGVELGKCHTKSEKTQFENKYPKANCFTKEDIARVKVCWYGQPHDAVKGIGTTYEIFMKSVNDGTLIPDERYYKDTVALIIIYRWLTKGDGTETYKDFLKQMGNAKATVAAYTLAFLNEQTFGNLDLQKIWKRQMLSLSLWKYLTVTAARIYDAFDKATKYSGKTILSYGKTKEAWAHIRSSVEPLHYHTIDEDLTQSY